MTIVDDRYQLGERLGEGSQGTTHLSTRLSDGQAVVVKELRFDRLESWKSLELFEREAQVLRTLGNPRIPAMLDSFQWNHGEVTRFFLVQEYIAGRSLQQRIDDGAQWSDHELRVFAIELLGVLAYLHALVPPVLHRDIKPANIIERTEGGFALVDFGGAQVVLDDDLGGSTVVGTTGYMPPEQLSGRARPQSDLYALGATMVHLATGQHPRDLPRARLELQWKALAPELSDHMGAFIDRLVQPIVEDRFASAEAALGYLEQHRDTPSVAPSLAQVTRSPATGHLERLPAMGSAVSDRIDRRAGAVVFDFAPTSEADLGSTVLALVVYSLGIVGFLAAIASSIPKKWALVVGIVVVLVQWKPHKRRAPKVVERLRLVDDLRFSLETSDPDSCETGVLADATLGGDAIELVAVDGTRIRVGGELPAGLRHALYTEIRSSLANYRDRPSDGPERLT